MREAGGVKINSTTGVILEGSPEDKMGEHAWSFTPFRHGQYAHSVSEPVTPTFQRTGMVTERGEQINMRMERVNQFRRSIARGPKLEFPKFNGENPLGWIRQAEKYF